MPNHVHLILTPKKPEGLGRALGKGHRLYGLYGDTCSISPFGLRPARHVAPSEKRNPFGCSIVRRIDVRLRKIVADKQERRTMRFRAGVGEAVAHVESGGMPAFAETLEGDERNLRLTPVDRDDSQIGGL